MKWGPEYPGKHDLSSLRLLGTVGEPINPKAWLWYHKVIGGERCPIVDTWWQTETGHIMISPLPGITETKPGSATFPVPGIKATVANVPGHRLSTAEVESAVVSHPKVAECAVIGQSDEDTGQAICAFVTLKGTIPEGDEQLEQEIRDRVAQKIGKLARPKRIIW